MKSIYRQPKPGLSTFGPFLLYHEFFRHFSSTARRYHHCCRCNRCPKPPLALSLPLISFQTLLFLDLHSPHSLYPSTLATSSPLPPPISGIRLKIAMYYQHKFIIFVITLINTENHSANLRYSQKFYNSSTKAAGAILTQ